MSERVKERTQEKRESQSHGYLWAKGRLRRAVGSTWVYTGGIISWLLAGGFGRDRERAIWTETDRGLESERKAEIKVWREGCEKTEGMGQGRETVNKKDRET